VWKSSEDEGKDAHSVARYVTSYVLRRDFLLSLREIEEARAALQAGAVLDAKGEGEFYRRDDEIIERAGAKI
jgi:hypothetical protein